MLLLPEPERRASPARSAGDMGVSARSRVNALIAAEDLLVLVH